MRFLIALFFLAACSCNAGKKLPPQEPTPAGPDLAAKFDLYMLWSSDFVAPLAGWVDASCDALLFTGLRSVYVITNVQAAERAPGEWGRRPTSMPDCFDTGESKSRISRDQLIGVGYYVWKSGRRQVAGDLVDYANKHKGIMGPGLKSRTKMSAALKGTLIVLADREGVERESWPVVGIEDDFTRHLAALHLNLRAEIQGGMPESYREWIEEQEREEPTNPLYAYVRARWIDGNYARVDELLMDTTKWPNDRLPDATNFCGGPWVIQRNVRSSDWQPCGGGEKWSGSDWLFVAALRLGRFAAY